jgi:hypothetical protein
LFIILDAIHTARDHWRFWKLRRRRAQRTVTPVDFVFDLVRHVELMI